MTLRVGDLVEDKEGDKAEVMEVDPERGVRVTWDCRLNIVSGWLPEWKFSNISERVRELDGERWSNACRADAIDESIEIE